MKHRISLLLGLALLANAAMAQQTSSAYFTDGYLYRHQMNAAIGNDQNYVSFPVLGNLNLRLNGNIGVRNLLYNVGGKTVTFMHPDVATSTFTDGLSDVSKLYLQERLDLISVGFKAFGGYNTVTVSERSYVNLNIPSTLLVAMKEGFGNQTYDFGSFGADVQSFAEIALGHSRAINEQWRVGGKLKFLLGLGSANIKFNKASLTLGENAYSIVTNAEVNASVANIAYKTDIDDQGNEYVSGVNLDKFGLNGFGLALDLGAEFKLNDQWRFSLALNDLGYIHWSNNVLATTGGDKTFTTADYSFNVDDESTHSFSEMGEQMGDDLARLYQLENRGDQGGRSEMLRATLNAGAEWTAPFYDRLSFGVFNTLRFAGDYTYDDCRISANVRPLDWLSGGINLGVGTFGASFGWILNIHPTGFNFFVGMDHLLGQFTTQGMPLNKNLQLNMGINFPF